VWRNIVGKTSQLEGKPLFVITTPKLQLITSQEEKGKRQTTTTAAENRDG
jgi:hypothetical protein